jgi:ABC-type branched-subunit amino acid transport system ATPase component/ABC-type branched-subunit amino acid transport system permease subunit
MARGSLLAGRGWWAQLAAGPVLALVMVLVVKGGGLSSVWTYNVALVAVYGVVVLSVSLLAGWGGVWSVGHPAMFAIGAYTAAYGSAHGWPLEVVILAAMAMAAVCGAFLGYAGARFSVLYISLLTLAFNLVVLELIGRWPGVTGGDQGVPVNTLTSAVGLGHYDSASGAVDGSLVAFGVTLAIAVLLRRSALRMRLVAVKSHPSASRSIGIAPELQTALGFAVSAAFTGLAGVFLAMITGFVSPDPFSLSLAVTIIAAAVLGGIGSIGGAVVGGAFLALAATLAGWLSISQPILEGGLLIVVLLVLPKGVVPAALSLLRWLATRLLPRSVAGSPRRAGPVAAPAPRPAAGLEITELTVRYGGLTALDRVSLRVRPGEILAIIGPNGAGKTTLINALSGLYGGGKVTGSIRYRGTDLLPRRSTARRRLGIARTFQHAELFGELTLIENVLCAHRVAGRPARRAAEQILDRVGLADVADRYPRELPFGLQKRADLARAIAEGAALVVLDEPFGGLDAPERAILAGQIRDLNAGGATVVIVDHVLDDLFAVADRVVAFDFGSPIAEGPPESLLHDDRVRSSYLGMADSASPIPPVRPGRTAGTAPALSLRDVGHHYAGVTALRGVTLEVATGTVLGVVGANGAGKSTLGRIASGVLRPSAGDYRIHPRGDGRVPRCVLVPEGRQLFKTLSVRENLEVAGYGAGLRGGALRRRVEETAAWLPQRVRDRLSISAGALSGGEQQMVAIARGLAGGPDILVLDEPALGLAPALVDEVYARIAELAAGGLTVILLEQLLGRALAVCHQVVVLRDGRVVAAGSPADGDFTALAERAYFREVSGALIGDISE